MKDKIKFLEVKILPNPSRVANLLYELKIGNEDNKMGPIVKLKSILLFSFFLNFPQKRFH